MHKLKKGIRLGNLIHFGYSGLHCLYAGQVSYVHSEISNYHYTMPIIANNVNTVWGGAS